MVRVITQGRFRVYVWQEEGGQHHRPHCHVEWADGRCVIALDDLTVLAGHATPEAHRVVAAHWGQITAAWSALNPSGEES